MDVEQLNIRIASDSSKATADIDQLIGNLQKLRGALSKGFNISSFSNNISAIATAALQLQGDTGTKLTALAKALGSFNGLSKVNISKSLANNITEVSAAASMIPTDVADKLSSIAQGINALNGVSNISVMGNLGPNLQAVANAADSINPGSLSRLNLIADGIRSLNGLSRVNISDTIGTNILNLGYALDSLQGVPLEKLQDIAKALEPLSSVGSAKGFEGTLETLNKFPETMTKLGQINISKVSEDVNKLTQALKPLCDMAMNASTGLQALMNVLGRSGGTGGTGTLSGSVNVFGSALSKLKNMMGQMLGARSIAGFIIKSNEYVEDLNLFTVAMGEGASKAQQFAEKVGEAMGIDPADWMRNQGIFQTLITGFGVTARRATLMSQTMTQLGYDLSSFFNISVNDAMQKLQSGISGELEPLRRLGYDLSQTRLKAEALALNIHKSFNEMTQAEKAQLRYHAIMTQVTTAQGDMARTLESPANQLRVLQSQFTQLARAIGNIFIPMLNKVIPYITAVVRALRELANNIAHFFGFTLTEVDYSGVTEVTSAAGDADDALSGAAGSAKKLKETLAGIDELNIIASENSGGGGSNLTQGVTDNWDFPLPTYDFLKGIESKIKDITAELTQWWDKWSPTVIAFGAGLLAWAGWSKLSNMVKQVRSLGSFNAVVGVTLSIAGIVMSAMALEDIVLNDNLSWQNILQDAFGIALETAGMAYIAKGKLGVTGGEALGAGFGVALVINGLTMSILSGIKAQREGVNWNMIGTQAIGAIEDGVGLMFVGNALAKKFPALAKIGMNKPIFGFGVGLAVMSLQLGMDAMIHADSSGVDWTTIMTSVSSAVSGGISAALLGNTIAGLTVGSSALMGFGIALTLASVEIGMANKIAASRDDTWDANKIWTEVATDACNALGIGLTLLAGGATLGTAVGLGITAAILITAVEYSLMQKATIKQAAADAFAESGNGSMSLQDVKAAINEHFNEQIGKISAIVTLGEVQVKNEATLSTLKTNLKELNAVVKGENAPTAEQIGAVADAWQKFDEAFGNVATTNKETIFEGLNSVIDGEVTYLKTQAQQMKVQMLAMQDQLSDAEARAQVKRDDILSRWNTGATQKEKQWYWDYVNMLTADNTDFAISELKFNELLSGAPDLNYDDPKQITDFFDTVIAAQQNYVKESDKAWDSVERAVLESKVRAGEYFRMGLYSDDKSENKAIYDGIIADLDATYALLKTDADGRVKRASDDINALMVRTLAQGMSGMQGMDYNTADEYAKTITAMVDSMVDTLQKNGMHDQAERLTNFWDRLYNVAFMSAQSGVFGTNGFSIETLLSNIMGDSETTLELATDIGTVAQAMKGLATMETPKIGAADVSGFVSSMNEIIRAANAAGQAVNAISSTAGIPSNRYIMRKELTIPMVAKANGGIVDEGQMFVAREAGPELVGTIGRKTAVVNNDQIVASVSGGVAQANGEVVEALGVIANLLRSQGSNSGSSGSVQPSASFGRFVKRSLELYTGVTG